LKKNLIDQNHADIDLKSDKKSFQTFAIIIIIESMFEIIIIERMFNKQENIKLTSNHQNAADFQISMKTSQHLIIELIIKLISELSTELISELTPELNTELATALKHEMNPEIEIFESYETAANDNHSSSFIIIVLKLKRYVE
jgi:hypothetical protein